LSWVVDGTLVPTRDHARAARSKNDRWSCNAQVLVRRRDLFVIATKASGPVIATIRSTTVVLGSRRCAERTVASSQTVAIAASQSWSPQSSSTGGSSATVGGGGIASAALARSTPLHDSNCGESCAIIGDAVITCSTRSMRS
jgi:hypothetical protein